MKFAASLLAILPAALAIPTSYDSSSSSSSALVSRSAVSDTDYLLFSVSLATFITHRNARNPGNLDWSSDSCSDSPDNPLGFDFDNACKRHDFGYRNYKDQGRFTEPNRLNIDNNFKDDLYFICQDEWSTTACEGTANIYYEAVREFGDKRRREAMAAEESEE